MDPQFLPITDELTSVLAFHGQHTFALGTVIALAESGQPAIAEQSRYISTRPRNSDRPDAADRLAFPAAFERRLRELGWIEGRNVTIEYRWAESRFERSPAIIAEFVRLKVDVIVTHGTANVVAAKEATVGHSNRICSGGGSGRQ